MTCNMDYYSSSHLLCQALFLRFTYFFLPLAKICLKIGDELSMLSFFLLILLIIWLLPTTFKVFFKLDNEKIAFELKIYPFGLFRFRLKKTISYSTLTPQLAPAVFNEKSITTFKKHRTKHSFLPLILKSLTIHHFSLTARLIVTDKPHLFKFFGLYRALYGVISPYLPPQVALDFQMNYNQGNSYLACQSIFSCSFGEIIFKALLLVARNISQKLQRRNAHGQPSYQ